MRPPIAQRRDAMSQKHDFDYIGTVKRRNTLWNLILRRAVVCIQRSAEQSGEHWGRGANARCIRELRTFSTLMELRGLVDGKPD
jgi:hypothetical protein